MFVIFKTSIKDFAFNTVVHTLEDVKLIRYI